MWTARVVMTRRFGPVLLLNRRALRLSVSTNAPFVLVLITYPNGMVFRMLGQYAQCKFLPSAPVLSIHRPEVPPSTLTFKHLICPSRMRSNIRLILIQPRVFRVACSGDTKDEGYSREDEDLEHISDMCGLGMMCRFVGFSWVSCLLRELRGLGRIS